MYPVRRRGRNPPGAVTSSPALAIMSKPSASRVSKEKATSRKSRGDARKLLTSSKSPLAEADLRAILSNPMAWSALDDKYRDEIISLFPDKQHMTGADSASARPNFASLMSDDSIRNDCAAYTESMAEGRHDDGWLSDAWAAHERRKAGDFDAFLDAKFEQDWGGAEASSESGDVRGGGTERGP